MKRDQVFAEFKAYWQIAAERLEKATQLLQGSSNRLMTLERMPNTRTRRSVPAVLAIVTGGRTGRTIVGAEYIWLIRALSKSNPQTDLMG